MRIVCYLLIVLCGCTTKEVRYIPAYAPFSHSVIHVKLHNDQADSLSISAGVYTNIPKGGNESNTVTAGKSGDYYLNIETDRPAKSFLNLGNVQYNVFLFPNDTTHISVNIVQGEIVPGFYGKAKEINGYYFEKRKNLAYTDIRFPLNEVLSSKPTYNLIKEKADFIINRELSFLEKYVSRDELPGWFLDYEESEIVYIGAAYKTGMPNVNEINKFFQDSVPIDYYDYLSNVKINNPNAILSVQYFLFLDDYFLKNLSVTEFNHLSGFSRMSKAMSHKLDQSKDLLSGDVRELYNKSNFSTMIEFYTDSAAIDSLANALGVSDYKEMVRIAGTRSRNELQMLNLHIGDTIPDFFLTNSLDSLISIRTFQNEILYVNFWATWCGPCIQNMPELNKLIRII